MGGEEDVMKRMALATAQCFIVMSVEACSRCMYVDGWPFKILKKALYEKCSAKPPHWTGNYALPVEIVWSCAHASFTFRHASTYDGN